MKRNRPISATYCPSDATGAEYVRHVGLAIMDGRGFDGPANREQLDALLAYNVGLARRHLPCAETLRCWGLPAHYGRDVPPFEELFKDRLLTTIIVDDEFRKALKAVLDGATV